MTQEEKLEEAKRLYKTANADQKYVLERLFPELKSEDERIRKYIISSLNSLLYTKGSQADKERNDAIAWLEKQGEHANFINKIQIGDKVTRNEDGVLVNLSQLKRVAKKQGEQKPAWSEEDETVLNNLIYALANDRIGNNREEYVNWLKSLKDKYTWKPSDEQMKVLENVRKILHTNDIYSKANYLMYNFEELIRTLNKLRGK